MLLRPLFKKFDEGYVYLEPFYTFSYPLEEEIELLEAIYIRELTVEGPRER